MKKYEAPSCELFNITDDIMTTSGLRADLSSEWDKARDDVFSDLEVSNF